jgi:DNA-binding transcriptional regulator GbsR (MarR family)
MTPDDRALELRFIEEMGRFFESGGIPRMAGRVWAYLLIVDAPYVSAADLQEGLGTSAGSISTATRFLLDFRLIDRVRIPGERRDYFAPRQGAVGELMRRRLERLTAVELLITDALEQFGDREHARVRLDEVHDIYHWYAHELPKLHERFLAERQGARANVTRR